MKFERDQNATKKIQIYINENKNLLNMMKVDKRIVYSHEILLNFKKCHNFSFNYVKDQEILDKFC
jgi:hypothetical protein